MKQKEKPRTLYVSVREEWRKWLQENFQSEKEIWLVFPNKSAGKPSLVYNDAVEEALCFGWIDSTIRRLDEHHRIQWFLPRKNKNYYSPSNRERLKWLWDQGLIHPSIRPEVERIVQEPFVFPKDILARIRKDKVAWQNYQRFSDSYKRLRVGYVESARGYDEEFEKRLSHFIKKTRDNKIIPGHGGINKYY